MKIVYYTADWCKPCQTYKPLVERLAEEFQFEVEYVDVSEKMPPGILSIPTLNIYDERFDEPKILVGAWPERRLRGILEGVR